MSKSMFHGGVHPPEWKELSSGAAIERLPAPALLTLPLSQHIGAPSVPTVKRGDAVLRGQPIAEAGGFVSVPLHAPVSGKVKSIEDREHPVRGRGPAIVIENDGEMTEWDGWRREPLQAAGMSPDEIRAEIRQAGIVGMGGAAFPSHVKLSPPEDKPIDTVVANGVECEPYLTSDHRVMLEHTVEVLDGLAIVMHAVGVSRAVIGIESNKPDAIEAMSKAAAQYEGMEVRSLPVRYPQGAEKQLIKACLDREVPSGGLPMDVGVVVQNVGTCKAIRDWFIEGRPLIERVVTVSGQGIVTPKNLLAVIGTPFEALVQACGGMREETAKLVSGGPMMGMTQSTLDVAVTKGTSGILALYREDSMLDPETACVNCGRCTDACPMQLVPSMIAAASAAEDVETAQYYGLMDCMECGCCVYVCPSRRYLVQYIRYGKAAAQRVRAQQAARQKAKEAEQARMEEQERKKKEAERAKQQAAS